MRGKAGLSEHFLLSPQYITILYLTFMGKAKVIGLRERLAVGTHVAVAHNSHGRIVRRRHSSVKETASGGEPIGEMRMFSYLSS